MLCTSNEKMRMVTPHCHYFKRYPPLMKNCGWSHHKSPLIATILNACASILSLPLLQMLYASNEKLRMFCNKSLQITTTLNAMLLHSKTADGRTTGVLSMPLLSMLCAPNAKPRMVAPQDSSHCHHFTCYAPLLKNCGWSHQRTTMQGRGGNVGMRFSKMAQYWRPLNGVP